MNTTEANRLNISRLPHRQQVMFGLSCAKELLTFTDNSVYWREYFDSVKEWVKTGVIDKETAAQFILDYGGIDNNILPVVHLLQAILSINNTRMVYSWIYISCVVERLRFVNSDNINKQERYLYELLNYDKVANAMLLGEV